MPNVSWPGHEAREISSAALHENAHVRVTWRRSAVSLCWPPMLRRAEAA